MTNINQEEMTERLEAFLENLDRWDKKEAEAFNRYDSVYKETKQAIVNLLEAK